VKGYTEGASERVVLKRAVDGTLIVPDVLLVMSKAGGRRVANFRYSNRKVSWDMIEACDALNILRSKI
jgi:hypothetical protein